MVEKADGPSNKMNYVSKIWHNWNGLLVQSDYRYTCERDTIYNNEGCVMVVNISLRTLQGLALKDSPPKTVNLFIIEVRYEFSFISQD